MGTQKNHLNEMVLLSTQEICSKLTKGKKIIIILINFYFTFKTFAYQDLRGGILLLKLLKGLLFHRGLG